LLIGQSTEGITVPVTTVERSVACCYALLVVAALINTVIEVDKALFTADCRSGVISYQPGSRERQAGGQDNENQNPSHQPQDFYAKHRSTPSWQLQLMLTSI
jgi:hypothetical protein